MFTSGASQPDLGAARLAVMLPFLMLDRFGNGLLEVLFGFKSPREAFGGRGGEKIKNISPVSTRGTVFLSFRIFCVKRP